CETAIKPFTACILFITNCPGQTNLYPTKDSAPPDRSSKDDFGITPKYLLNDNNSSFPVVDLTLTSVSKYFNLLISQCSGMLPNQFIPESLYELYRSISILSITSSINLSLRFHGS